MPPRAISPSNSYWPKERGSPAFGIVDCGVLSSGPPSSMTTERHFSHRPRGASWGNVRPHFGQTAMSGDSVISSSYPLLLKRNSAQTVPSPNPAPVNDYPRPAPQPTNAWSQIRRPAAGRTQTIVQTEPHSDHVQN